MKKLSLILCLISLSGASSCCAMDWHKAAETGNLERLQQLIKTEPKNINKKVFGYCLIETPLHLAVLSGGKDAVELLLKNGADVDQRDYRGMTPLHWAAEHNKVAEAEILLANGANVDTTADRYITPLHQAAIWGNAAVMTVLLKAGADIKETVAGWNIPSRTALDLANLHLEKNKDVVQLLRDAESKLNK